MDRLTQATNGAGGVTPIPTWKPPAEMLATLGAALTLAHLARPLTDPQLAAGLGRRYLLDAQGPHAADAARLTDLVAQLPVFLAVLAVAGWLALRLARSRLPVGAVLLAQAALWLAVWSQTLGRHYAASATALAAAGTTLAVVLLGARGRRAVHPPATLLHPLAYPGWVLFSGIGLLWLVDYSARAYPKFRYLALAHADALLVAYAVMTATCAAAPVLMGVAARVLARLDSAQLGPAAARPAARWVLPALLLVWSGLVLLSFGRGKPALTSELLRAPLYLAAAWSLHRWAGQGATRRAVQGAVWCALALAAGLATTGDAGQLLVGGIAASLVLGIVLAAVLGPSRPVALGALLAALALVWGLLQLVLSQGHLLSIRAAARAEALLAPFEGRLEYLSELRWFAAATPASGHGLGQVPWCGTVAALDPVAVRCAGVPQQTQSDYVFAALGGIWGTWTAAGLTLALAVWMVSLVRLPRGGDAADPASLRQWTLACFVLVTLVQLLYTCLGSLGLVPLTGVTYPLVAHGAASLTACALFVGLALRRS